MDLESIVNGSKELFERSLFGVCSQIGEKIGVASSKIRLYFVYTSLLTLGSPIFIYLILAFWVNIKKYVRSQMNIYWE